MRLLQIDRRVEHVVRHATDYRTLATETDGSILMFNQLLISEVCGFPDLRRTSQATRAGCTHEAKTFLLAALHVADLAWQHS